MLLNMVRFKILLSWCCWTCSDVNILLCWWCSTLSHFVFQIWITPIVLMLNVFRCGPSSVTFAGRCPTCPPSTRSCFRSLPPSADRHWPSVFVAANRCLNSFPLSHPRLLLAPQNSSWCVLLLEFSSHLGIPTVSLWNILLCVYFIRKPSCYTYTAMDPCSHVFRSVLVFFQLPALWISFLSLWAAHLSQWDAG